MNGFTLFAANEKTFLLLYLYKTLYVKSVLCSEVQHLLKVFDFSGPPWTDFGGRSMKPAASASSFRFFYKNENFVTPLWKMRFPRKNVDTWPPTPQKSEWSVLFSSSHIFVFFLQFKLCSKFLRISKIRLYSNLCRCRFSKFTNLKNRGVQKFGLQCR